MSRSATDRSHLSIREVLELLVEEFPDVTISKIRFLESRGLIHPERTPSGYRKFHEADVERLRWILRQQREHFLPLKVIKGRLEGDREPHHSTPSLFDDAAREEDPDEPPAEILGGTEVAEASEAEGEPQHPGHRTPLAETGTRTAEAAPARRARNGSRKPAEVDDEVVVTNASEPARKAARVGATRGAHLSADELAHAAGIEVAVVAELESFGLLEGRDVAGTRCYDEDALLVARSAAGFRRFGLESRHLRTIMHAAEREAGLYSQVVTPLLRQRNPAARTRAHEDLAELTRLGAALREVFVRTELRRLTGG